MHHAVDVRGTRIHYVEEGSGPLVVLVHGFPESWYSWRHQIPVIAEAGFRVVAIDVRGYGRSSAPHEVEAYGMVHHVGDTVGLVGRVLTDIPGGGSYGVVRVSVGGHVLQCNASAVLAIPSGTEVSITGVLSPTAVTVAPVWTPSS